MRIVACGVAALVSFGPVASVAEGTTRVTHSCDDAKREPRRILLECYFDGGPDSGDETSRNDWVNRLEWKMWGARKAVGHGIFHRNDCDPTCADGTVRRQRGKLVLRARRSCEDYRRLFKKARAEYGKEFLGKDRRFYRLGCPAPLPY